VSPEPKGLFVLEALASGVPVVQPRHGSFPEFLENTGGGLLHEPGDAADLAAKLGELLRSPERRLGLGEAGREAVHTRFSSRRMAEDTLAIYRKVVRNGLA
jgi:glycosyltransferase involved in cell wall biosynthesis